MAFVEVVRTEAYRMRSSAVYRGDLVQSRELLIGGKRFESSRVFWGDGSVTVSITPYGKTTRLHEWQGRPVPLECGHVPSYGCDCDTVAAEAGDQTEGETVGHVCRASGHGVGLVVGELDWPPYAAPGEVVRLTETAAWGRVDLLYRCCGTIDVSCYADQDTDAVTVRPCSLGEVTPVWSGADYPANVPPTGYRIPAVWPRTAD